MNKTLTTIQDLSLATLNKFWVDIFVEHEKIYFKITALAFLKLFEV